MLELRNPHSVMAVLKTRPNAVRSVTLSASRTGTAWDDVAVFAQERGIRVGVGRSDKKSGPQKGKPGTQRVGAGSAEIEPPSPVPLENLFRSAHKADSWGVWLALDQVQDPQNLGAVFRLAGFFGVRGIVMTKDRSASVTGTACDVATGGVEYIPFAVVPNLAQAIQKAQKADIWVLGTCERADDSIRDVGRDRHWMLVMGNEGDGIRRLTRESCDKLVSLPSAGPIPSLNVAAATAACLTALTNT